MLDEFESFQLNLIFLFVDTWYNRSADHKTKQKKRKKKKKKKKQMNNPMTSYIKLNKKNKNCG